MRKFRYTPLFTVSALHDYFTANTCAGVTYVPFAATSEWMRQNELLHRSDGNELTLLYDQQKQEDLLKLVQQEELSFDFYFCIADPFFISYTDIDMDKAARQLFAFTNTPGSHKLHQDDAVSSKDLVDKDKIQVPMSMPGIVLGVISVKINTRTNEGHVFFQAPQSFTIQFKSRPVFSRYLITNKSKVSSAALSVHAQRGKQGIAFSAPQKLTLPNGEEAFSTTSEQAVPLRQLPATSYQLYNAHADGKGDMLVQYLPYPSPQKLVFDPQLDAFVAELFVHL